MPIRRLQLAVGEEATIDVIDIDVDTLATSRQTVRYQRLSDRRYQRTALTSGDVRQFDVDEFGLVVDEADRFRRAR